MENIQMLAMYISLVLAFVFGILFVAQNVCLDIETQIADLSNRINSLEKNVVSSSDWVRDLRKTDNRDAKIKKGKTKASVTTFATGGAKEELLISNRFRYDHKSSIYFNKSKKKLFTALYIHRKSLDEIAVDIKEKIKDWKIYSIYPKAFSSEAKAALIQRAGGGNVSKS